MLNKFVHDYLAQAEYFAPRGKKTSPLFGRYPAVTLYLSGRQADLAIGFLDEEHIRIRDTPFPSTGPSMHIRRTGQITGFYFLRELCYDPLRRLYALIGVLEQEKR